MRNPSALAPDAVEDDDVTLEADSIGKRGQQAKRNAVNIDGYQSDSSNEGFDARADAKAKASKRAEKSKDEEQDDMFADMDEGFADGDEDEAKDGKRKKKNVRFLDANDIEGQADYSKTGGHVSMRQSTAEDYQDRDLEDAASQSSSSESEVGDEARAALDEELDEEVGAGAKKKHAPRLDAFNLNAEQEGGRFDEQYNYVRQTADPNAVYDTWMEGVSKREMRRAREAHDKREQERREKIKEDDAKDSADILKSLISNMEIGETVLEALARLGKGREKKKPKWQSKTKRQKQVEMDVDREPAEEDPAEQQRKEAVEAITDAADLLLSRGEAEIYDRDRELLVRRYQQETGEEWKDPEEDAQEDDDEQWEYRWPGAEEVHGPYNSANMEAWSNAGYFGAGVEFRIAGDETVQWSSSAPFLK